MSCDPGSPLSGEFPLSSWSFWRFRRRWNLSAELAARVAYLQCWCRQLRIPLEISSGHRSIRQQQQLYEAWRRGEPGIYRPALPGRSRHNLDPSQAVDLRYNLADLEAVTFLAEWLGMRWAGPSDPVHFTFP